ncbi:acetylcholinesterase [Xylariaceae sp. FL1272]|nr:acetylcholinesterase [Xylariaceae sp. FL1272]
MKSRILAYLVLGIGAVTSQAGDLTVKTSSGTFTGLIDPQYPNTRQFRAIPFAEPPVGTRRWLPPQKLSAADSDTHIWSTKFPPSCAQFVSGIEMFYNIYLSKGNTIYNGAQNDTSGLTGEATSEDCLYLAVWTPAVEMIPEEGLPVLFFMTGGGFTIGGIELPWQIPVSWVERSQSHIVVSINYRLGIFGFPNARGLADGEQNLGILDQRAALEWTRDNIAAFGGDPTRITQWGRSAGAVSTDVHAYAYRDDPIAQAYYMESGLALAAAYVNDTTHSQFSFVASKVGCAEPCGPGVTCDDEGSAELDCMRQVSMIQITNFIGDWTDRAETPAIRFALTPDERIVFSDYIARSDEGKIAARPALISYTANEAGASILPWPDNPETYVPDQDANTAADIALFVCPAYNSTVYRNRLGAGLTPVFRFQYAAEFPNFNVYDWLGAYHNSETALIFGTYWWLDFIANSTEFEHEVSRSMQDHILAFAQDPYNGPQALGWQPMNTSEPNGGDLLRFGGSSGKVAVHVDGIETDAVCQGLGDYDPFP